MQYVMTSIPENAACRHIIWDEFSPSEIVEQERPAHDPCHAMVTRPSVPFRISLRLFMSGCPPRWFSPTGFYRPRYSNTRLDSIKMLAIYTNIRERFACGIGCITTECRWSGATGVEAEQCSGGRQPRGGRRWQAAHGVVRARPLSEVPRKRREALLGRLGGGWSRGLGATRLEWPGWFRRTRLARSGH